MKKTRVPDTDLNALLEGFQSSLNRHHFSDYSHEKTVETVIRILESDFREIFSVEVSSDPQGIGWGGDV
ncbi:MAG: hypothetical protein HY456_01195 [Parcubacteria group bacterium]|nr:hypothetical protein [Parcubacteria group bacterium]